jgi:DNA helicase-2/ATP-dependent DNA helicase PcrA
VGFLQALKEENTAESLARRENIQELVSALTEFSDNHTDAHLRFPEEVSLVLTWIWRSSTQRSDIDDIACCKGPEFPVCYHRPEEACFLNSSLSRMNWKKNADHVCRITRAMQKLYLICALTRYRFGELGYW